MEGRNYMSGRDGRKELCEWAGWKECLKMFRILCVCVCAQFYCFLLLFCCSRLLLSGHLGLVRVLSLPNMAVP